MPVFRYFRVAISKAVGFRQTMPTAKWTEGLLNAFCAGILIHLGLVDLIAVEFNDENVQTNLVLISLLYVSFTPYLAFEPRG